MVDKTKEQRKEIEAILDSGHYDFNEANLFKGAGKADQKEIMETLRTVPLKEFLAKSGTTGIAGDVES